MPTTLYENRPSAGIGVVEVQKLEVFCDFVLARATLCGQKLEVFLRFLRPSAGIGCCSNWSSGVVSWFTRRVAGSIPKLHGATCIKQLAQSNLRRATCTDQFAQSALPRATCAEQLTQSNLHRATCTEQLAGSNLHGAICTEQLEGSHLQGPTCTE